MITVEVPVNVTPVKEIETPVTKTSLTKEDYTKGITIPEGGKVTNVENLPDLTTPGKKNPVKVTVELPNGKVITVEVPVTVTPINEIVKKVGEPITDDDVKKNVKIPEGGKIISIGEKPGTDTPGEKPVVQVVIELPNGKQITVEVPVKVVPKDSLIPQPQPSPGTPAPQVNKVVTRFVDENGKDITSPEEGLKDPKALEGYVFDKTTTDKNGTVFHHYKKATAPTPQPVEPATPGQAEQPAIPTQPATPATPANAQATSQAQASVAKQELPNTGMAEMNVFAPAVLAILGGLGLAAPALAKKKDEE